MTYRKNKILEVSDEENCTYIDKILLFFETRSHYRAKVGLELVNFFHLHAEIIGMHHCIQPVIIKTMFLVYSVWGVCV